MRIGNSFIICVIRVFRIFRVFSRYLRFFAISVFLRYLRPLRFSAFFAIFAVFPFHNFTFLKNRDFFLHFFEKVLFSGHGKSTTIRPPISLSFNCVDNEIAASRFAHTGHVW